MEAIDHQPSNETRRVPFAKLHACGNDFLVIDEQHAQRRHAEVARRLCARNTGIGADGIEFLDRRGDGTMFLRLFNSDGSEAELSGNGTRCVAAWLALTESRHSVTFGTHGGVRSCGIVAQHAGEWLIRSAMGVPRMMPRSIEIAGFDGVIEGAMVNVGNPHFVVFTEDAEFAYGGVPWQRLGGMIATDAMFPHGTNVEFVKVLALDRIAFRIFERGCGPTTSSGTGTSASAAAAMTLRATARSLTAEAEGGAQQVEWPDAHSQLMLTGPAAMICAGEAWL